MKTLSMIKTYAEKNGLVFETSKENKVTMFTMYVKCDESRMGVLVGCTDAREKRVRMTDYRGRNITTFKGDAVNDFVRRAWMA